MRFLVSTAVAVIVLSGCRAKQKGTGALASAGASASAGLPTPPPWDAGKRAPPTPEGMVWIPPGALVAGTPRNLLPRIADEEMEGEQVVLDGFFMSIFPYPNEEAAIPLASVTQEQARGLCEKRSQRLCTELEWERACKGPDNHIYEYGDHYRADICGTGAEPRMLPVGLRLGCRSDFGVRDMHGSLWEWTASSWNRGTREALVAVRGGNSPAGELTGRCANGAGRPPTSKASTMGFRCCSGPANHAEVTLHVERGPALERRQFSAAFLRRLEAALPDDGRAELRRDDTFRINETWLWHPIGNEELVVGGGCTAGTTSRGCGMVVARLAGESTEPLAWASSGVYVPSPRIETNPRFLWIYGGDVRSHYRRLLTYAWGRVALGELQRNVKLPPHRPPKNSRNRPAAPADLVRAEAGWYFSMMNASEQPPTVQGAEPLYFPEEAEMPETKWHLELRTALYEILKLAIGDRAIIGCDQFVYWDPTDPKACLAPDSFVRLGKKDEMFGSWKVWERGAPHVAVEFVSEHDTKGETWAIKFDKYRRLGVLELVRFDADDLGAQLSVWDHVGGHLVKRELADPRRADCRPLGLSWVVVDYDFCGTVLRLADPVTNALLPTPAERAEERVQALEEELRRLKASRAR